jgi:hypothetical protein
MADGYAVIVEVAREMGATLEPVQTSPDFRRVLLRRGAEAVIVDLVRERVVITRWHSCGNWASSSRSNTLSRNRSASCSILFMSKPGLQSWPNMIALVSLAFRLKSSTGCYCDGNRLI